MESGTERGPAYAAGPRIDVVASASAAGQKRIGQSKFSQGQREPQATQRTFGRAANGEVVNPLTESGLSHDPRERHAAPCLEVQHRRRATTLIGHLIQWTRDGPATA